MCYVSYEIQREIECFAVSCLAIAKERIKISDFFIVSRHEIYAHLTHRCHCLLSIHPLAFVCSFVVRILSFLFWIHIRIDMCVCVWFCFEWLCFHMNDEQPASSWLITATKIQNKKKIKKNEMKCNHIVNEKNRASKKKEIKPNRHMQSVNWKAKTNKSKERNK